MGLVVDREGLAVEYEFDVGIPPSAGCRSMLGRLNSKLPELLNCIFCNSGVITSILESNFSEMVFWPVT